MADWWTCHPLLWLFNCLFDEVLPDCGTVDCHTYSISALYPHYKGSSMTLLEAENRFPGQTKSVHSKVHCWRKGTVQYLLWTERDIWSLQTEIMYVQNVQICRAVLLAQLIKNTQTLWDWVSAGKKTHRTDTAPGTGSPLTVVNIET